MLHEKWATELNYQSSRAAGLGEIRPTPAYVVDRYRRCPMRRLFAKEFMFSRLGDLRDKKVVDFGCGEGQISCQLALLGAHVTGIDISAALVELARKQAELDNVTARVNFIVVDIAEVPPPKEAFHFIVSSGSLHHTDLHSVLPVLYSSLRRDGLAIFSEPIAFSSSLQKLRDCLPIRRTPLPTIVSLVGTMLITFVECLLRAGSITSICLAGSVAFSRAQIRLTVDILLQKQP